jgi:hypothetical protein
MLGSFGSDFQGVTVMDSNMSYCLLTIGNSTEIAVVNSTIEGVLPPVRSGSADDLSLFCAVNSSNVQLHASRITNNNASAMFVADSARAVINASIIEHNQVNSSGAGLFATDTALLHITGSSKVVGNVAYNFPGGGICAARRASVFVSDHSIITNNTSVDNDGGGIWAGNSSTVTVEGSSRVASNTAFNATGGGILAYNATVHVRGRSIVGLNKNGGLFAFGSAHITIANSTVTQNTAKGRYGAGVYLGENSTILITNESRLEGNVANGSSGAGLAVAGNASATISGRSVIRNNTAYDGNGGGVAVMDQAELILTGESVIADNASPKHGGGGIYATDRAVVHILGLSSVVGNKAKAGTGGGILANSDVVLRLSEHIVVANNSGGGLSVFGNASASISGSSIEGNTDTGTGAGMFVGDKASASIIEHSRIVNNIAKQKPGGGLAVGGNATVNVSGGITIAHNKAFNALGVVLHSPRTPA